MANADYILFERPAEHIARIVLNRPEARNAQDTRFLYELNDAYERAAQDESVKVIITAANGPHFSSGHDLRERDHLETQDRYKPVTGATGYRRPGAEGRMAREEELYTGFCERWRNIPKPTIAAVQGKCVAGGLMLAWPSDIIIAADDAVFEDVTLMLGIPGVELFAHPWELGPRKAKEMLFAGAQIGAEEARQMGMVNRVVPRANLESATLELAQQIALRPSFALRLAKLAVNNTQDAQGRPAALTAAFAMHHIGHSHCMEVFGLPVDPSGVHKGVSATYKAGDEPWRQKAKA
ncbi:MAG: enoyl-CoA hydratase [Alphaproteobacteria bacterium]|nr:enoyl-CoA hydratase [Alphaproteobacteria bacterium]